MDPMIGRNVAMDEDLDRERQFALNTEETDTREMTNQHDESLANAGFSYVNPPGPRILETMEEMKKELMEMRKESEKRREEFDERRKESEKHWKGVERMSKGLEELQKHQSMIEEWGLTIRPLQQMVIAIRRGFFSNYRRLIGETSCDYPAAITDEDIAAYKGDLLTDIALVTRGDIMDSAMFRRLYGVSYQRAQSYLESEMIVNMINKRATMLASPTRGSQPWDAQLQQAFENVLSFFDRANSQEWIIFEMDAVGRLPEKVGWLRIIVA